MEKRTRGLQQELKHHEYVVEESLNKRFTPPRLTITTKYDSDYKVLPAGTQYTESEGHPWRGRKAHPGDIGGPFYTRKSYWDNIPASRTWVNKIVEDQFGYVKSTFNGPVWPLNPTGLTFPAAEVDVSPLIAAGTTAIARCSPTNSIADAATFLGELVKDGIPNLPGMHTWKEKIRRLADAGDEFLNVSFGWLPLLSDVKSHAKAINQADAVMRQYERDAGKMVRRSYYFPTVSNSSKSDYSTSPTGTPYKGPYSETGWTDYFGYGKVTRTVETVQKRWFKGAFTYHLPDGYSSRKGMARNAAEAKRVFGATLTPDVLWELTPWSWAIDWFSNAGDVVHNLSSWKAYGLVLRYGYMMEETINRHTYAFEHYPGQNPNKVQIDPLSCVTITKRRVKANPFGFGITWDGLSPLQTAIAAALGISRT